MVISVDLLSTYKVQSALLSNAGIAKECNQSTCSQGWGLSLGNPTHAHRWGEAGAPRC